MNLTTSLESTVRACGAKPALVEPEFGRVLSYPALLQRIDSLAAELDTVRRGDCVGLYCQSGEDYIVATYALWQREACVTPIADTLTNAEQKALATSIRLEKVLFGPGSEHCPLRSEAIHQEPIGSAFVLGRVPTRAHHPAGFHAVNAAFLRFSSGTTGSAKGVVLSHRRIWERIHAANKVLRVSPDDRVLWLLSMAHHFAVSIVLYLSFGATIVLGAGFMGRNMARVVAQQRVTLVYASPSHYWAAVGESCSESLDLSSLRLAVSTASPLRRATAEAFEDRFGLSLSQAYGIIEVGLPCIEQARHGHAGSDSVGPLLPAYELRLEDAGLGAKYQHIGLRGPGMFDAYYEPWQPLVEVLDRGFFATGDLGYLDADRCLHLSGRSKTLINVAGAKCFPDEIEAVLLEHPQVREALVYPLPHLSLGEVACAKVVLTGPKPVSAASLRAHCAARLAPAKVPHQIQSVLSLPKTASGKLLRDSAPLATDGPLPLRNDGT